MDYIDFGATGLKASVAGLGCGGNSRVGLGRGKSAEECVALVRTAIDLGVNLLDTAEGYGTEEIVGEAAKSYDRDKLIISTKAAMHGPDTTPETVTAKVEGSLKRLDMDYVDVFHFHAVHPNDYAHVRDVLAPALVRLKEAGKVRHVGLTETGPKDPEQKTLRQAVHEDPWEVFMLAYSLMNQAARKTVFPYTQARGVGTLLMFVVRNIFSRPDNRRETLARLVAEGQLPARFAPTGDSDPLEEMVRAGGAESVIDAAYRFARHEAGADVILFGTGDVAHLEANIASILAPPLDPAFIEEAYALFSDLIGVGLDLPDRVKG